MPVARARYSRELREAQGLPPKHYARYSPAIIEAIEQRIGHSKMILDPMAGTLERLSCLEKPERGYHLVWGVELEPEWAEGYEHERLIQGDARSLPYDDEFFDAIVVSPSYGNRDCDKTGTWWDNASRMTYAGALGRDVSDGSGCIKWGPEYRTIHAEAWVEAIRVLKPNGLFFINLKNFVQRGAIVRMAAWHKGTLIKYGLEEIDDTAVPARGRPSGANYDVRAEDTEKIYVFQKPKHLTPGAIAILKKEVGSAKAKKSTRGILVRQSRRS